MRAYPGTKLFSVFDTGLGNIPTHSEIFTPR
jgi:hypothetical protein